MCGPLVLFLLGPEAVQFTLVKRLVIHCCPELDLTEEHVQSIRFPEYGPNEFQTIIEWITTKCDKMTLPEDTERTLEEALDFWLQVAKIAAKLGLFGDCKSFLASKIRELVKSMQFEGKIQMSHLMPAVELPVQHPIRLLFAEIVAFAFVFSQWEDILSAIKGRKGLFENSEIASDILLATGRLMLNRNRATGSDLASISHPVSDLALILD